MPRPIAIVLGAAVWEGGVPSPALMRRIEKATALYRAGRAAAIMGCGGVGKVPPAEADVIAGALQSLGVPPEAILREDRSRSTLENLRNAKALLPPDTPAIIVTDPWHLPRARLAARRLGLNATGAATSLRGAHPLRVARAVLREIPALAWYALRRLP